MVEKNRPGPVPVLFGHRSVDLRAALGFVRGSSTRNRPVGSVRADGLNDVSTKLP